MAKCGASDTYGERGDCCLKNLMCQDIFLTMISIGTQNAINEDSEKPPEGFPSVRGCF